MDKPTFNSTAELRQYLYDHDLLPLYIEKMEWADHAPPPGVSESPKRKFEFTIYVRNRKVADQVLNVLRGPEYYVISLK